MWTMDISPKIFSRVKAEGTSKLKTKYPNIEYTTSNVERTEPKFPSVYLHEVGSTEQGQDIEGSFLNAVLTTFQVDVKDNESQERANEVMAQVVKTMKNMRFSVISMPEFQNTENVYRSTARFRRMIGHGDIL